MFRITTETRTHAEAASSTKTSRLPTLAEEGGSEPKVPENVPVVREEADGKDEAAEVHAHTTRTIHTWACSLLPCVLLPPGPGDLQPVPAAVVSGHHQHLPRGQGHQLQHFLEKWPGLLRHPASLPSRENVEFSKKKNTFFFNLWLSLVYSLLLFL